MIGIFKVVGEALAIVRGLTDPTERKKAYETLLAKQAQKALEAAEQTYHLVDEYIREEVSPYSFEKRYKYLRKRFFKYD